MSELPSAEELLTANPRPVDVPEPIYQPGDSVVTLTLDQKQAWVLAMLTHPWKDAQPDDWEFVRAMADVHHRLAEIVGTA